MTPRHALPPSVFNCDWCGLPYSIHGIRPLRLVIGGAPASRYVCPPEYQPRRAA